jgi:hypothetical protein
MLHFVQNMQDTNTSNGPIGEKDVDRGDLNHIDEILQRPFMKTVQGAIMLRFHPTDRTKANVIASHNGKIIIVAVVSGDIRPGVCIHEYIPQAVVDVPPFVPPADWGEPVPLDDLFASGLVKKG